METRSKWLPEGRPLNAFTAVSAGQLDFVVNLCEKVGLAKSMAGDLKIRLDPVCEILTAVAEIFGIPFGLGRQTRAVIRVPLSVQGQQRRSVVKMIAR